MTFKKKKERLCCLPYGTRYASFPTPFSFSCQDFTIEYFIMFLGSVLNYHIFIVTFPYTNYLSFITTSNSHSWEAAKQIHFHFLALDLKTNFWLFKFVSKCIKFPLSLCILQGWSWQVLQCSPNKTQGFKMTDCG